MMLYRSLGDCPYEYRWVENASFACLEGWDYVFVGAHNEYAAHLPKPTNPMGVAQVLMFRKKGAWS